MAVALGQVDAGAATEHGLVQGLAERPAGGRAGQGQGKVEAAVVRGQDVERVVHVAGGGAVDTDEGQVAGGQLHLAGGPLQGLHGRGQRLPPVVAGSVARAVIPEIVMGGHLLPGHEQLHGQVRHVGQALGEHTPQFVVFLALGVGHAGEQDLLQTFGHFGGRPFGDAPGVLAGLGRQRAFFAGHVPEQAEKAVAAQYQGLAGGAFLLFLEALFHHLGGKDLEDGRLEAEVALAGQQGPPAGGDAVGVPGLTGQFGEPLGRGFRHLALAHFPQFQHGQGRGQFFAAGAVLVLIANAIRLGPM